MKRQNLIAGLGLLICVALGGWWYVGRAGAGDIAAQAAEADDAAGKVLVRTAAVRRQSMPVTMQVFGEVGSGKVESLGFPQAGQLVQLLVTPGQPLHRGDPVASLASDPATQSAYAQAAGALSFAQRELRRNQDLLVLQLATQSQVDAAARQVQDAQATLNAQIKSGGSQDVARLLAPFDGVVLALPAAQGDRLAAGATVAQLGRNDVLRVQLAIEPEQSGQLRAGMPVAISRLQDGAQPVRAVIGEVQKLVDQKTQMVGALALLPAGRQAGLLAGMRVRGTIELGQRLAWSVPRQAVLNDERGAYLFQVAANKARRVDVRIAVDGGPTLGVDGKLDAVQPVVVLGNYELQDGMAVRGGAQ